MKNTKKANETSKWIAKLHEVLSVLDGIDVSEDNRRTLRRCVSAELSDAVDRFDELWANQRAGDKWTEDDDVMIHDILRGAAPKTWQDQNHLAASLSRDLFRPENSVRKRAIYLGYANVFSVTLPYRAES